MILNSKKYLELLREVDKTFVKLLCANTQPRHHLTPIILTNSAQVVFSNFRAIPRLEITCRNLRMHAE